MRADYDVIVLGTGTMGSATCAELARRGRRVLGLDRFGPPHEWGSHHGTTRLFRKAYFEHPDYVPLLHRAGDLWEEANRQSGEAMYIRTGGLFGGPPEGEVVRGMLESARRHGLPARTLPLEETRERYPQLRVPEGYVTVFDEDAAVLLAERAVRHFCSSARSYGAEMLTGVAVERWEPVGDVLKLQTRIGEYTARSLIVTCGAWASQALPTFNQRLTVTRQVLGWVRPIDPRACACGALPVWGMEEPDGSMIYGAPLMPGEPGVKVARHARGEAALPESVDRTFRESDRRDILQGAGRYLACATDDIVDSKVCLYTNSSDSHFFVGALPGAERVYIACGFSGHGFKFAPVIGEILADLAAEGRTNHDIRFLSPGRCA